MCNAFRVQVRNEDGEFETVERGLSSGEVRQSLLDRVLANSRTLQSAKETALQFGVEPSRINSTHDVFNIVDEILYNTEDSDLVGREFSFRVGGVVHVETDTE